MSKKTLDELRKENEESMAEWKKICPIIASQSDDDYKNDEEYWSAMWHHVVGNQDIRRPGEKIKDKLAEETKWAMKFFGVGIPTLQKGGPKDENCTIHDWSFYEGFSEDYEFCVKCDLKRNFVPKGG